MTKQEIEQEFPGIKYYEKMSTRAKGEQKLKISVKFIDGTCVSYVGYSLPQFLDTGWIEIGNDTWNKDLVLGVRVEQNHPTSV
jgi:hypothetical protein